MPPKEKSHIERLKEKIYSAKAKDLRPKDRGIIFEDIHDAPTAWKKEEHAAPKPHKSLLGNTMFRKFFLGAGIFFFVSLVFGVIMFFGGRNTVSADNIDINVLGNAFVSGGEELPLKFEITNRNNVSLEYGDLLLEYQKGAGAGEEMQRDRFDVGTIPAGNTVEELVNLVLFGQQGTTRDINITLEYRVKGSSAIFVKQELYVVNISSTPVNLLVEGPETTSTNQEVSFDVTVSANTEKAIENMMIVVDYPPGFDFKSASPEPTFSNNIWSLGDLSAGAEKKITVTGVIVADAGEDRAFNIYTGVADPKDEQKIGTQFNSQDYKIAVEKPFLDMKLLVNGRAGDTVTAQAGEYAEGEIELVNNLETKITDVEIVASLSGNVFDTNGVRTNSGFYNSTKQEIVWNSETMGTLSSIDPGEDRTLAFSFRPISFSGSNIKNPEIKISLSVRGRQSNLGNQFMDIDNVIEQHVKFGTQLQLSGYALYNSGPFTNTGPLPPHAGSPTTYTVYLSVANTTSKATGVKVRAQLPLYVDWVGAVSPNGQNVGYSSSSREIVWDVGTVDPGAGLSGGAKQVYFQVRLNPSNSQSGTTPALVSDIVLTGKDAFTNADLSRNLPSVNTRLNRDANYNSVNDEVQ